MVALWRSTIVLLGLVAVATAQDFASTNACQPVFDNNNNADDSTGFVRFDVSAGEVGFFVNDIEFVADISGTFNVTDLAIFDGSVFLRAGEIPSPRTVLIDANNVITLEVTAGATFRLSLPAPFEVATNSTVGIQVRFANNGLSSNPPLVRFSSAANTQLAMALANPDIFNGDTIRQWGSLMVSVGQAYVDNVLVDSVVFHGGVCVTNLEQTVFVSQVDLTSDEVVPPISVDAPEILGTASASVVFDESTFLIRFDIAFSGLSSNPTEIGLFNPAARGESVNQISQFQILVDNLGPDGEASSETRQVALGDDAYRLNPTQRDQLFTGLWYVEIRTENNPQGELRAQIEMFEPSTNTYSFPLTVDAVEVGLDGDFEEVLTLSQRAQLVAGAPIDIPALDATATANIIFMSGSDDPNENLVSYDIQFTGLTGEVTNAFFQYQALNTETSIEFTLPITQNIVNDPNAPGSGTIIGMQNRLGTQPDKPEIESALGGLWYLNLNTVANPEGEIRAQVNRGQATIISSAGSGFATLNVDTAERTVRFQVEYEALSSMVTGVEIRGPVLDGEGGDPERGTSELVVVATTSRSTTGARGIASGVSEPLSVDILNALTMGEYYVVVLTTMNPLTGELRGTVVDQNIPEIIAAPTQAFAQNNIPLTVEAEINALDENVVDDSLLFANATGVASVSYSPANGISWDIEFSDLSGELVAAHFHGPAGPTSTAGVRVDLLVNSEEVIGNTLRGGVMISEEFAREAAAGLWYINLHTPDNLPTGEIRGQLVPNLGNAPPPPIQEQVQLVTAMQTGIVPLTTQASLNAGVQLAEPVNPDSVGMGMVTLYPNNTISWDISYMGPLSSPVTLIHFHGPASVTEQAGVQITVFDGAPGTGPNPNIGSAQLPDPAEVLRDDLLNGLWYINIHTELNPMGELRGQVVGFQNIAIDINQGAEIDPVVAPPIDVEDDDAASSSSAASLLVLVASAVAASISVC